MLPAGDQDEVELVIVSSSWLLYNALCRSDNNAGKCVTWRSEVVSENKSLWTYVSTSV